MKVFKYGTGDSVPKGAIYLCSIKNGDMIDLNYPSNYKCVWHYFLVEEEVR